MSLVSALYTGVSGIQAFSGNMQVIGNNIANVNTVGFKTVFGQMSDRSGGSMAGQIGRGVRLSNIETVFDQGSFQNTAKVTDLAIDGSGFFVLSDATGSQFYTRTGVFHTDQDGLLISPEVLSVQGFQFSNDGVLAQELTSINLSNVASQQNPTSLVTAYANLDASEEAGPGFSIGSSDPGPPPVAADPDAPADTSNFFTSVRVYDSLGADHTITIFFNKTADNEWEWHALVPGEDVGSTEPWYEGESGTLSFTTDGSLDVETQNAGAGFDFTGGATPGQNITFDFGDSITTDGGTGIAGTVQAAKASIVSYMNQDGFASGELRGISIDRDGVITGVFSNGRTREIYQVALASFRSETGLRKAAGNLWIEAPESGTPRIDTPGTGAAGNVLSNTLELSNVDLANEFVQLITNQRALQASARMLTTSDDMLNEVVNLKR